MLLLIIAGFVLLLFVFGFGWAMGAIWYTTAAAAVGMVPCAAGAIIVGHYTTFAEATAALAKHAEGCAVCAAFLERHA